MNTRSLILSTIFGNGAGDGGAGVTFLCYKSNVTYDDIHDVFW